jgi:hypothetical protein
LSLIRGCECGLTGKSVVTAFSLSPKGLRSDAAKAECRPAMLPGFRFLLAAIALCSSILVFGLGAAALLRAAHEEVAQNPSWRGTPEPRLVQFEETPVLAMLRIEPVAAESDILEAPASPASAQSAATEAEASAIAFPTSDDDKAVAPHASESSPPIETAETDAPSAQTSTPAEVLPAPTLPGTATGSNIASVEQASPASDEQPLAAAPVLEPMVAEPEATKTAFGTPPSAVEAEATKNEVDSEQDREEAKKRLRAERAKERRRLAARRARLAEQAAIDPFGQLIRQAQLTQQAQLAAAKRKTR